MKHSVVNGSEVAGQEELSSRASEIREQLSKVLRFVDEIAGPPVAARVSIVDKQAFEKRVREMLKLRRRRESCFGAELFADPAWDILLELYAAELAGQRVSVSSLCLGAAVPATTALRWITLLAKEGMIVRTRDPLDGRRVFISLTNEACAKLDEFFIAIPAGAALI